MKDKGAALLIGIGKPKAEEEDAEAADEYGADKVGASQELIAAVQSGDAEAVASAFESLYAICAGKY